MLLTHASFSQNEMRVGVNSGATLSKFRGNDIIKNTNPGIGFLIGLSFEYSLSQNISLKTNLNYSRKSFSNTSNGFELHGFSSKEIKTRTNYDYLELPILIKYVVDNSERFFVNGGPFLGYLLKAESKTKGFLDNDSTVLNKKMDLGLSIGIGTIFRFDDKNNLSIELRNNLGLINISDVKVYRNETVKTNSLNLILGWNFEM